MFYLLRPTFSAIHPLILPVRTHFLLFLTTCLLHIMTLQSYYSSLHKMMAMVQRWVFTVGGQPQINDSLGPLLTHFFSPELCHILKIGTTAHLGLVRAKDTRYAKLGREENRGAPPHLQPQPVNQNQGLLMWSGAKLY